MGRDERAFGRTTAATSWGPIPSRRHALAVGIQERNYAAGAHRVAGGTMTRVRLLRTAFLAIVLLAIPARAPSYWRQFDPWPSGSIVGMQMQLGSPTRALTDGSTSWGRVAESALGTWNLHLG